MVRQFSIFSVALDPTVGSEITKSRPYVVVSPDEMNQGLATVIIAPMTSTRRQYASRVDIEFQGKLGQVALDQLRTVDKRRLTRQLGEVTNISAAQIAKTLTQMFTLA